MMQRLIADKAAALDLAIAVTGRVPPNSSDVTRFQCWLSKVPVLEPIDGAVLLFYQYCEVDQPQMLQEWQQALCKLLRLRVRRSLACLVKANARRSLIPQRETHRDDDVSCH